ncbi:MAG: U32 family peptidase [Verrucomicrobia bacterium]|nr:U32 family peptidase [Verrucomicrobiota bacterium]
MGALAAALSVGANAVYFGVGKLNMRAGTRNHFSREDLSGLVERCHAAGVKAYLTVNTVIYDDESVELQSLLEAARIAGIDAIIAADFAVIQVARDLGLTVHLSTQANVSNFTAVKFFANFVDVIVLARELSLEQVSAITGQIRRHRITGPSGNLIRIEIFIHGAMCMAISGKCYLSLHQHNASANRGSCLQLCRRHYTVMDEEREIELGIEDGYVMSPKDLKTVHFIDQILAADVSVLKIEGRGRSPDYVSCVTRVYREAVQAVFAGRYALNCIEDWDRQLAEVFNRGFWNGYYLGQTIDNWTPKPNSQATKRKEYVGVILSDVEETCKPVLRMDSGVLHSGDEILIIGDRTGVVSQTVGRILGNSEDVETIAKGQMCQIETLDLVHNLDKVYKWVSRPVEPPPAPKTPQYQACDTCH